MVGVLMVGCTERGPVIGHAIPVVPLAGSAAMADVRRAENSADIIARSAARTPAGRRNIQSFGTAHRPAIPSAVVNQAGLSARKIERQCHPADYQDQGCAKNIAQADTGYPGARLIGFDFNFFVYFGVHQFPPSRFDGNRPSDFWNRL